MHNVDQRVYVEQYFDGIALTIFYFVKFLDKFMGRLIQQQYEYTCEKETFEKYENYILLCRWGSEAFRIWNTCRTTKSPLQNFIKLVRDQRVYVKQIKIEDRRRVSIET